MAKEMNVKYDFVENILKCELPEHMMDVLLKVRTRSGEHTFRENIYTRTLKYRRWNNELRLFCSLKRRVANMFRKRDLMLDDSKGTLTQTIINQVEEEEETRSCSDRESINSDWSDLLPVNKTIKCNQNNNNEASTSNRDDNVVPTCTLPKRKTVKNIVLVPYKPQLKDWGSWHVKSPYATSTIPSPNVNNEGEAQDKGEMVMCHIAHTTLQFTL